MSHSAGWDPNTLDLDHCIAGALGELRMWAWIASVLRFLNLDLRLALFSDQSGYLKAEGVGVCQLFWGDSGVHSTFSTRSAMEEGREGLSR